MANKPNITHQWWEKHARTTYRKAEQYLSLKMYRLQVGKTPQEVLHHYYIRSVASDKLATRLAIDPQTGEVVATKPMSHVHIACFAFQTMWDQLDKELRRNCDLAQFWRPSEDGGDRAVLKDLKSWVEAPSEGFFETIADISDTGEITTQINDPHTLVDDEAIDLCDEIEKDALLNVLAGFTGIGRKSGRAILDARSAVVAYMEGKKSRDYAKEMGLQQGHARTKMNAGGMACDHYAHIHREGMRILVTKLNGGTIGNNADPYVVELMQQRGLLSDSLQVTEYGKTFEHLPRTPSKFKESLTWYLCVAPTMEVEETEDTNDEGTIPALYQALLK